MRNLKEVIEFSQAMARLGFELKMNNKGDFVGVYRGKNRQNKTKKERREAKCGA